MKKLFRILSIISVLLTSLSIIFTLLTTYQFIYINQIFNSYYPIQLGIIITMILWGLRFLFDENGEKRYAYSIICGLIAITSMIFIYMSVR